MACGVGNFTLQPMAHKFPTTETVKCNHLYLGYSRRFVPMLQKQLDEFISLSLRVLPGHVNGRLQAIQIPSHAHTILHAHLSIWADLITRRPKLQQNFSHIFPT